MSDPSPALVLRETGTPADAEQAQVADLLHHAEGLDGVGPLSEDGRLALAGRGSPRRHLLALLPAPDGERVVGYLSVEDGSAPSAEVVVDPDHRREGVATALLDTLGNDVRVWAHGDLPAAQALAAARGATKVRELLRMARPLAVEDVPPTTLPDGFSARGFVLGQDDQAVVDVNTRAFAHHPEQGRMGLAGLHARTPEPWFDPDGLVLVEDTTTAPPTLAAFHWTKTEGGADGRSRGGSGSEASGGIGEVYVVGVDPTYQGRGLARPLTALGLAHLAGRGVTEVELYVEGDNAPARATYEALGFTTVATDVMYSRAVHPPVGA